MLHTTVTDRPREESARKLSRWLIDHKAAPALLLLSGGSALSFLHLVRIPEGASVTISMLDERFSVDPSVNNFLQLSQTPFFSHARERKAEFLSTLPDDSESLEMFAARLTAQVENWRREHPDGIIIATQGIGNDGHTAGILPMPQDENLFEKLFVLSGAVYVGYEAPEDSTPFRERATVTVSFLKTAVAHSLTFAAGPQKAEVLRRLLAGKETLAQAPMHVLHEMREGELVTDIDPTLRVLQ